MGRIYQAEAKMNRPAGGDTLFKNKNIVGTRGLHLDKTRSPVHGPDPEDLLIKEGRAMHVLYGEGDMGQSVSPYHIKPPNFVA